jgi:RNA polymerase sigma-70 factor (ECF subfamily)
MQGTDSSHPSGPLTPESLEDEWLAVRCQLGEPAAFDALVARWHAPLWNYIRRLLGDDDAASETCQEVWLKVIRGIARLRDGARLRAWLFGIARRTVMDRLRVRYAAPHEADLEMADLEAAHVDPDVEGDSQLLHDALEQLPVIEREVLVLFYLRELSLQELTDVLAVPLGTVKSRLFRARRLLRTRLHEKGMTS